MDKVSTSKYLIFGVNFSDMDGGTRVRVEGWKMDNYLNYKHKPLLFLTEDYKLQAVKALDGGKIQDGQKMDKKRVREKM